MPPSSAAPEQEELELRAGVDDVAQLLRPLDLAAEDAARVADERLARGREHVADHAGRAARPGSLLPRDLGEGRHVGHQVLVALGDPGEALDRRPVEPGPVLDRALELVDRDRHRLDVADDVGELELDEADAAVLGGLDLRCGVLVGHWSMPPVHDVRPAAGRYGRATWMTERRERRRRLTSRCRGRTRTGAAAARPPWPRLA